MKPNPKLLSVRCPFCHARKGQQCRRGFKMVRPHPARRKAWCDKQGRWWNHGRQIEVEGWLDPETGERHEVGEVFPCAEGVAE